LGLHGRDHLLARTSTPWALLPVGEFGCGSVTTCWRRFAEWAHAGVFERLQELLLDELSEAGALDWSRISLDSFSLRAVRGDLGGANPVDRAKPGSKLHLAVEGGGLPLLLLVTGANTNDSLVFEALLDDLPKVQTPAGGRRCRPEKVHADKAYDHRRCPRLPDPPGGSRSASPAAGSSRRPGWAATGGRQNARSPGWPGAGGCASATTDPRSGSLRSRCWPATGCAIPLQQDPRRRWAGLDTEPLVYIIPCVYAVDDIASTEFGGQEARWDSGGYCSG
jgi:transposase